MHLNSSDKFQFLFHSKSSPLYKCETSSRMTSLASNPPSAPSPPTFTTSPTFRACRWTKPASLSLAGNMTSLRG
ncbi:hypothetical protein PAMP_000817 [Pampus punctatissimus]